MKNHKLQIPKAPSPVDVTEGKQIELNCTEQAMAAYYTVYLDGKKLFRRKSESFHQGFYTPLYGTVRSTLWGPYRYEYQVGISNVEHKSYGLLFHHADWINSRAGQWKYLIFPNSPEWNTVVRSFWSYNKFDASNDLPKLDSAYSDLTAPERTYTLLSYYKDKQIDLPDITDAYVLSPAASSWGNGLDMNEIVPGVDDRPINIIDASIINDDLRIGDGSDSGQLNHGSPDVFPLNVQKEKAFYTISRTFNNLSGDLVTVKDINVLFRNPNYHYVVSPRYAPLYIRDRIPDGLTVPHDSTLTIEYEIGVQLDLNTHDTQTDGTNGGFLSNYIHRIWAASTPDEDDEFPFNGLLNHTNSFSSNFYNDGNYRGIVVGTNDGYVSMTDQFNYFPEQEMFSVIHSEVNHGPLEYFNTKLTPITEDYENQEVYWDVKRVFRNISNSDVVIKEIGMVSNAGLIARHALHQDDWVTIQPGKAKEISYRIKFTE